MTFLAFAARSQLAAFERLGYTTLVAEDLAGVQRLYKPFADLVRVIIMQVRVSPIEPFVCS